MTLKVDDLLQHKALPPLPQDHVPILEKIQTLNIENYAEAEVRAYVIDPIVKMLGYEKGTTFSPDLERRIDFIDSRKYIDYKCTLWEENFWIIEAKRPAVSPKRLAFEYPVFKQALEYAVHPNINAALIVLCDGDLFEVYDREENVTEPLLRFNRSELLQKFDDLRALLSPWQVWFFEKRRITRLIDKVFDREFNLQRLAEFRLLVDAKLQSKRAIVLKNYQASFDAKKDHHEQMDLLRSMPTEDIVDGWFFLTLPAPHISAMIYTLVDRSLENPFAVLYKLFPDHPRDASDTYYVYALEFLMALHRKSEQAGSPTPWLPAWLRESGSANVSLEHAIQTLMAKCLTQFRDDAPRKLSLLCYTAVRRIMKRIAVLSESEWVAANQRFASMRFFTEEISWSAFASSPAGFVLQSINSSSMTISSRLFDSFKDESGNLQLETGKLKLKELWAMDADLIKNAPTNYVALLQERGLGETYPSESVDVTIDYLGHLSLCRLESFPVWKAYAMANHRNDLEALANLGSWKAEEWLHPEVSMIVATERDLAERFFFGDIGAQRSLAAGAF
jgi:Type I restriction enzyme R protein N terminus (HSDR_N)